MSEKDGTAAPVESAHTLLRALFPATLISLLVALIVLLAGPLLKPSMAPVTRVQASPAELPSTWLTWAGPAKPAWRPVTLPLSICSVHCTTVYTAWQYSFEYSPATLSDPAVFFPRPGANIAVYLNGSLIDMRGRMQSPPSVYGYAPRLIRLPLGLLRAGANQLNWRVTIERPGLGDLSPFYLGNYAELVGTHRALSLLTQDLILGGLWMQLAVWLVALAMYLRGNDETVLSWFLIAAPGWMAIAAMHVFPSIIHSISGRSVSYFVAFYALVAFTPMFVTALLEKPKVALARAFIGYFWLGIVLTLLSNFVEWPDWRGYNMANIFLQLSALCIIPYIIWRLFRYLSANRSSQIAQWVFAATFVTAIFGIFDVIHVVRANSYYMLVPLAGVNIAAAMCLELGRRMLLSQAKLARYSDELESTVKAREAQLNVQFQALRRADSERTLSEERSRIMRDMHDGVGGQLAVLVHMADDPKIDRAQIVEVVRTGLADMRLILDSLNHAGGDLLIALGTFRERITPLLNASNIRLQWQVDHAVQVDGLGPEVVLNLFRILQEAINNAVRHAHAKTITMAIAQDSGAVLLSVADDGVGFDPTQTMDGHYGLSGMQRRAEKIGALLRVSAEANAGTVVSLRLGR